MKSPGQSNYQPEHPQPQVPASKLVPYGETAPANHQYQSYLPEDVTQTAQLGDPVRMLGMNGQPADPNAQQQQPQQQDGDLAQQVADLKLKIAELLLKTGGGQQQPVNPIEQALMARGGGYDTRGPGSDSGGGNIGMGGRGSFF